MKDRVKNFFILIFIIHILSGLFYSLLGQTPFLSSGGYVVNKYALEHNYYFLVVFFLSIFLIYYRKFNNFDYYLFLTFIKKNIKKIFIIFFVGLIFQKFPDWDTDFGFGHRSIFTHSLLFPYLLNLYFQKNSNKIIKKEDYNSVFYGMIIGITSHLIVDSSYMFLISPLLFLTAHKGHGSMPLIDSGLEIPIFLFLTLSSTFYLIRISNEKLFLKENLLSITSYKKIFNLSLNESYVMLFFSLSMLFNSGKSNIPSTLDFGIWAFIFVGISFILHLKSRYVQ